MRYHSTRERTNTASFAEAALRGLAPDGGLYVPDSLPPYPVPLLASLPALSYAETAFRTILPFVEGDIPAGELRKIVDAAYTFDCPSAPVGGRYVLELFHGPTAAFKDFGARFMARAFSYLRRGEERPLDILVATSGDTGGAVASGFAGVEGVRVTILYPKGRVTPLQERQIALNCGNIRALAVEGSFDDCQSLVKKMFSNPNAQKSLDLSSANSINIARLLPQSVYYTYASARIKEITGESPVVCVPSGNFGNLTAGLYAQEMGAPIARFAAATNINRTVPEYLETSVYTPRASVPTLSNAMDVGAPSNFERMASHWDYAQLRQRLLGVFVTDAQTKETIKTVHSETGYTLDPHGAVGWRGLDTLLEVGLLPKEAPLLTLETAHPAKFRETVDPLVGETPLPPQLAHIMEEKVHSTTIPAEIPALLDILEEAT